MPEVAASATICCASPPPTPGATRLPSETLAGAWMAWAGTLLPSGRAGSGRSPAVAVGVVTPRRLAVHAADSSAIGTSAVALCRRPNRLADILLLSPSSTGRPLQTSQATNECCHEQVTPKYGTGGPPSEPDHPFQRRFPSDVTGKPRRSGARSR